VEVRGGLEKVCKDKKWAEIGRDLGYSGKIMSSLSTSLKNSYQRWLHPYEEYLRLAKPGVHQQHEYEYGGPCSPAVSQTQSPMTHPYSTQNPLPMMTGSPAMQASAALNATIESAEESLRPTSVPPQSTRPVSSGFTAVNSGGFNTVNAPSGFTAVNQTSHPPVKMESSNPSQLQPHYSPPSQAVNSSIPAIGSQVTNGNEVGPNPLKRTVSHDSIIGDSGSDEHGIDRDITNGRRSKRAKRDLIPPGSEGQLDSIRGSTPTKPKPTRKQGENCETCSKNEDITNILVCDNCEVGYHLYCLDPSLTEMPDYNWQCSRCLVGTNDYGFEEGSIYSLKHFQEKANNFKEHYFAAKMPFDPISNTQRRPTEDDVEREFWRLVENLTEQVEVEYGADIHSTTHGSGFPTVERDPLNPYAKDAWNLNVLPFHEESLFRHIKGDISGMTVPWLYVGMCFSTFCWHNEDHYAYSANYQHFGATKTWYGIPAKDSYNFEMAMRQAVPELFETQPDLLFQLVTILPPDKLVKAGVEVFVLDQRAGQFVITFPQAYHAGFNHGFNFNEAVNFAPADWEPFGEAGVQRLQDFKRPPCFSHDELLFTAAASDTTIKTAKWLGPALERTRDRELTQRHQFIVNHKAATPHQDCVFDSPKSHSHCGFPVKVQNIDLQEEEYQCCYCKAFAFMSQFRCHHTQKVSCLLHAEIMDCCAETPHQRLRGQNHSLIFRYTDQDLRSLVQKVVDKANIPEIWEAKYQRLLDDEARPTLRNLHTLLTEGEKIPYPLAGLNNLADFVKRCDQWVEEANLYLTRKQQNRRKNEKAWRRSSLKASKADEKDSEPQLTLDRMKELLSDGDKLGFQAPQFDNLQEKLTSINDWQTKVKELLGGGASTTEELETLLDEGKSFMATMPELMELETLHQKTKWTEDARLAKSDMPNQTLDDCKALLNRAVELQIPHHDAEFLFFTDMVRQGDFWEIKAKEVMAMEDVHYPQLESLHSQVQAHAFPVNKDTLQQMDIILAKNREAKRQIITLVERSQNPDFRQRPMYAEVRDVLKALEDLNGKPHGTADLEKELKRHEDWMRKGKKLFGKANAPLHILEQHMKTVEETNSHCFDLDDTFRPPVEPASREASPSDGIEKGTLGEDEKPVFCICRKIEAGLMLECDICHEWYVCTISLIDVSANLSQVSCKVPQTSTWQGQRD
jgi:[histone H3]-trimethyl-L-lysine4 demethylase